MAKIWNCLKYCLFTEKVNCCCKSINRYELYNGIFGIILLQYAILIHFGLVMALIFVPNSNLLTGACNQKHNIMCHNNQLVCSINNWSNYLLICPIYGIPGNILLVGLVLLIYFLIKYPRFRHIFLISLAITGALIALFVVLFAIGIGLAYVLPTSLYNCTLKNLDIGNCIGGGAAAVLSLLVVFVIAMSIILLIEIIITQLRKSCKNCYDMGNLER